jgi:hypothetical protein
MENLVSAVIAFTLDEELIVDARGVRFQAECLALAIQN